MDHKTVGINLQPLAMENLTGIGIYAKEISQRLLVKHQTNFIYETHVFDFLARNQSTRLIEKNLLDVEDLSVETINLKCCELLPLGGYIRSKWLQKIVPYERLLQSKSKGTLFLNYLKPQFMRGKSIITVYDLVCYRYPETMDRRNYLLLKKHLADSCAGADHIVTISEFSKAEIVECLKINPDKISVAYCGIDPKKYFKWTKRQEVEAARTLLMQKYNIKEPFFLYLGTLEPRKNIPVLLEAWQSFSKLYPQYKLILAGGKGWNYEEIFNQVERLDIKNSVLFTGFIEEKDKRFFYWLCEAFVFPSLYEGFGLPPLEAMACGAPVIASKCSSLPEVVGEAGLLCDPQDSKAFCQSMSLLINDIEIKERLKSQQAKQLGKFSWDESALLYYNLMQKFF